MTDKVKIRLEIYFEADGGKRDAKMQKAIDYLLKHSTLAAPRFALRRGQIYDEPITWVE